MSKITAEEARKLAGPSVQDNVDDAYKLIRKAATEKKNSVNLYGDFWVRDGYASTPHWEEACDILRGSGFTVKFFYEERQFVDMYTVVEW